MTPVGSTAASLLPWDLVIVVTAVCVIGSGFCSGCETGLMSVSRVRLWHATRQHPHRRAEALQRLLGHLEDPILTCLIGTNLFLVLGTAVLTVALSARYGARGELLAMVIMSVVIIIFGEILPKVLYREYPERLTLASVGGILGMMVVLAPVRWLLRAYSLLWRRLLPPVAEDMVSPLDRQGVSALLLTHTLGGSQDLQFRQSLRRFLELANLDLGRIMRPLAQIVTVPASATVGECLQKAARSGYSRLPVRAVEGDDLEGWILVRDLLFFAEPDRWDAALPPVLVRTPLLVDEAMSPHELFEELHAQGQQLAVVVDRRGGALGMVTLEDLIETVIGSIQDEFDTPYVLKNV